MDRLDRLDRRNARFDRRQVLAGLGGTIGGAIVAAARPGDATGQASGKADSRILTARTGKTALRGAGQPETAILGYEGVTPGPLIRLRQGEELRVRFVNQLGDPTTVHWHGLRISNAMAGVPHLNQPPVAPGESFDYRFSPPDAGTFWYHAHPLSSEQVGRGLYGALVVDEARPVAVDRDVTLVIGTWRLSSGGEIERAAGAPERRRESPRDHLTVNGSPLAAIETRTNERLRLRLVNASPRMLPLRVVRHTARVMAIDGQPAEPFPARDGLVVLSPGNRMDLFIDAVLSAGTDATLLETVDGVALAKIRYSKDAPARPSELPEPEPLPANSLPARLDLSGSLKVDLSLDADTMARGKKIWSHANSSADVPSEFPLFSVKRERAVTLAVKNPSASVRAIHLYGHSFRLLDRLDDGWKPFWLDSVAIPPGETLRLAFRADNPGKWMLHGHAIDRPESGMGAWFAVS